MKIGLIAQVGKGSKTLEEKGVRIIFHNQNVIIKDKKKETQKHWIRERIREAKIGRAAFKSRTAAH